MADKAELVRELHFRNKVVNDVFPTLPGTDIGVSPYCVIKWLEDYASVLMAGAFLVPDIQKARSMMNEKEWYRGEAPPSSLADRLHGERGFLIS